MVGWSKDTELFYLVWLQRKCFNLTHEYKKKKKIVRENYDVKLNYDIKLKFH